MHPWVRLSDRVRLGVVTRWVTPELVADVLEKCGVRDKKPGALPAGFMVYFTLALALFQQDSYDDVAEQLVGEIAELSGSIPNKSYAGAKAPGSTGPGNHVPRAGWPVGSCRPGESLLPWDASGCGGRVRAGCAGYDGQPGHLRRAGQERPARGIPADAGGDPDRVRYARAD
ncbi:transposase domain-containing protein [Streptomyces sp. NPDC001275]